MKKPDTITRWSGSFEADGFRPGDQIAINPGPRRRWHVRLWRRLLVWLRIRTWEDYGVYTVASVDGATVELKP